MSAGSYAAELHLHTCFSFLEGASQPEEMVRQAAALGYRALAITDHDGLHGAMVFAQACAAEGVVPIVGLELTLAHGLLDQTGEPVHLTLLAENPRGYANLCRLISGAHSAIGRDEALVDAAGRWVIPPDRPVALDPAALEGHTDGLIVLSGCRSGELARLLDADRWDDALAAAGHLADLFGPASTYVELQHNLVRGDTRRVALLAALADKLALPVVATGNVHYHVRERHRLQDAMVAIKHRSTLEASHRLRRPNSEFYLRSPSEVAALFAAYPAAIQNVGPIVQRCAGFNLANHRDLGYEFPDFSRQEGEQHASADDVLSNYCWPRFELRYPAATTDPELREKARVQLLDELRIVGKHHLSGFFLIYRDLQELATSVAQRVRGSDTVRNASGLPPGRGRGSSVSSIICYLIGLSHVDPVRNRLFFRRFLNEDLQAVPDIDLDFARDIREQLILAVYQRYGREHAALVCSFATYHLRSAVRDLGKVLGLPPAMIDKLARLSEGGGADTVHLELQRLPEFQGQVEGPLWGHLMELAAQIDGLPRHVGQHVGGMIISSRPLVELVPVQPASMEGRFICQWDKDSCDDARFIKIDFLALGMLSLVEECLELIWQNRGERVDFGAITCDDPAIYSIISQGDTVGMFQVESRAQIQMLTRTQPRNLDDLAVQVAIVRPGPIVGGAVNPYVQRREIQRTLEQQGKVFKPQADHPMLDSLLADTLGVVLYQDQVLEVAMRMGGFTPGQADQFRRAMSRRRSRQAMERFREDFLRGAGQQGVSQEAAQKVFEKLQGFSEFGFPKSHAYAFAVLAYQSAWLRYYYPAEYYAALFNNQPMGFYSPHVLVGDAKRHGISVLRVSINSSSVKCLARRRPAGAQLNMLPQDPGQVQLGLTTVRGLGEELARHMVAERTDHGLYRSLADLLRRTGLSRQVAEKLIAVGALSEFGLGRRELLWQLGLLLPGTQPVMRRQTRRALPPKPRQAPLALPTEQDMVHLEDMSEWERMVADYGLLGLSPTYHPMGLLRSHLPEELLTHSRIRQLPDGVAARTAGLVVCRQRPGTAKGFVFLLIEDETGLTNVVIRPDLYEARRNVLRGESYLSITGTVQLRSGSLNVIASAVEPLAMVPNALRPGEPAVATLPQPTLQHPHMGQPYGPRELPPGATTTTTDLLKTVTPASHNFH